jgi:hypothetical protein
MSGVFENRGIMMLKRFLLPLVAFAITAHAQTVLVKPYVQPGNGATLDGKDVKVLTWFTDKTPGEFTVEFTPAGQPPRTATVTRLALDFAKPKVKPAAPPASKKEATTTATKSSAPAAKEEPGERAPSIAEKEQHYFRYRAELTDLPFDSDVTYRVKLAGTVVRESAFKTRASAQKPIRFVAVGDLAADKSEQKAIAFHIGEQKPDFLVALGDIVYRSGRLSQYMHHFWTTYNDVPAPDEHSGAPLMASIPFYAALGNHDTDTDLLPNYPDAFSAFYVFSVPKNGPGANVVATPLGSDAQVAKAFRERAGAEYPALCAYSFDYGPAHFVSIDSNKYVEPAKLQPWLEKDLIASKQPWKFVCFHHPGFHSSIQHASEQQMRVLEPTFAKCGVNVVFEGHVHNYQRTKPLRFTPSKSARPKPGSREVDGTIAVDNNFNGTGNTVPNGIIHIVSGGGGATLYTPNNAKKGTPPPPFSLKPFTAKYNDKTHSFSVVELTPTTFEMRQVSRSGEEIDHFKITK